MCFRLSILSDICKAVSNHQTDLLSDLCTKYEVVIPEVPDPEDEAESAVPQGDDRPLAEDDGLGAELRPGQLGEHQAHHEGLDETPEHGLQQAEGPELG